MKRNGHKQFKTLASLTADPKNARLHTPRNVGTIVESLTEVGAARSIVIDEDGVVLAGNATRDAAIEAGLSKVRVVDADGDTIIAVRRTGLTKQQKTRLALFDNRAAELAEWSPEALAGLMETKGLEGLFTDKELAEILAAERGGETIAASAARLTLSERFLVPPFSVLDARQGYWQDRKRAWIALGIQSELGRGGNLQGLSESNDEYRYNKNEFLAKIGRGPLAKQGGGAP